MANIIAHTEVYFTRRPATSPVSPGIVVEIDGNYYLTDDPSVQDGQIVVIDGQPWLETGAHDPENEIANAYLQSGRGFVIIPE